eukprot:12620634-Alexandrium_andersonii.AAC.1
MYGTVGRGPGASDGWTKRRRGRRAMLFVRQQVGAFYVRRFEPQGGQVGSLGVVGPRPRLAG